MPSLHSLVNPEAAALLQSMFGKETDAETPEDHPAAGTAEVAPVVLAEPQDVPAGVGPSNLVTCADCPALVTPSNNAPDAECVVVCKECAAKRIASAKKVEIIHNPGGTRMPIDFNNLTDAELGAIVRAEMKRKAAERIQAATPAVLAQRAKAEADDAALLAERQDERKGQIMPGFMVGDHEVPDLDLTGVTDLHEIVSAKQRSIYNKALHKVGMNTLDPETTTYATLLDKHQTLQVVGAEVMSTKKGRKKKAKKEAKKVTAVVAVTETDKVSAVAEILGVSKKQARKLVNA